MKIISQEVILKSFGAQYLNWNNFEVFLQTKLYYFC